MRASVTTKAAPEPWEIGAESPIENWPEEAGPNGARRVARRTASVRDRMGSMQGLGAGHS
jgi:hypothetical protein